ncbi:MAG: FHA domain-containing protein [Polyangiaceae bacterium]|jgi:hypothetical protein
MACLRHTSTGALSFLEAEHLVGRSPLAMLRCDEAYVSMQHASIRWTGSGWELKDLGSRNGTCVGGVLIKAGQACPIVRGARVSFGSQEQTWEVLDDAPPRVMVFPLAWPHEPLFIDTDILPLPSPDDPRHTVFRGADGGWYLEREDGIVPLSSQLVFECGGQRYRFSCPDVSPDTSSVALPLWASPTLAEIRLVFRVSSDEEHVELVMHCGAGPVDLGARGHNYLLLLLARQRLADAGQNLPAGTCGWVYQDELVRALKVSAERLNIDIFRIRKQFEAIGLSEPASIVERRPRTKQLRIGVASLALEPI